MIQLIYFPTAYDRSKEPIIVFSNGQFGDQYKGSPDQTDLVEGRFMFFSAKRCQPYSDKLWKAIKRNTARRAELEKELQQLMQGKFDPATNCKHDFTRGYEFPCLHCGQYMEEFPF